VPAVSTKGEFGVAVYVPEPGAIVPGTVNVTSAEPDGWPALFAKIPTFSADPEVGFPFGPLTPLNRTNCASARFMLVAPIVKPTAASDAPERL
jgi:hypothetical protein